MSNVCGGRAFASRLGFELFRTRPDLLSASCMRRAFAEMHSSGRFGVGRLDGPDGSCGGAAGSADADCTARFEDWLVGGEGGDGMRDMGRDEQAPVPVVRSRSRSRTYSW
jgi:hypothetical protein